MGKRGCPKTPRLILAARGSALAKQPERASEPGKLPEASMDYPEEIVGDSEACGYFDDSIKPMFLYGLITVADRRTVIRMCRAWSRLVAAERRVREEGVTVHTEKAEVAHPALAAINGANDLLNRLESVFGIGPAHRSNVTGAITKRPPGDEREAKSRFFKAG